jgi:hypothetical protein
MEKASFSRRSFLRLSVITAGSAIAVACQQEMAPIVGTSTADPSPLPSVKFGLPGGNIDAWTWIKQVKVSVSEGKCEKVLLRMNGQDVEATPEGDMFTAEVPLAEGENQIRAVCIQPGGAEAVSDPVV